MKAESVTSSCAENLPETSPLHIAIIGGGNVAVHLGRAFGPHCRVTPVSSRTLEGLPDDASLYLICVSDNAISAVARQLAERLPGCHAPIAHTSGSTPIDVLRDAGICRPAVFYPLQTFSRELEMTYDDIPVFLEADDEETYALLSQAAALWTSRISRASSPQRRCLHLSSVFACNFANHLWTIAAEILDDAGLPQDSIAPLIRQTALKIQNASPKDAQTGPARRHDSRTIQAHLDMLADNPELQEIYRLFSESISRNY